MFTGSVQNMPIVAPTKETQAPKWRNNTPPPQLFDRRQRDCAQVGEITTPSTIISTISTIHSKSFEDSMERPCHFNPANEAIANQPNLSIPNLEPNSMMLPNTTSSVSNSDNTNFSDHNHNMTRSSFDGMPPPKFRAPQNKKIMQKQSQETTTVLVGHSNAHNQRRDPLAPTPAYYNANNNSNCIHRPVPLTSNVGNIKSSLTPPRDVYLENKNTSKWNVDESDSSVPQRLQPPSHLYPMPVAAPAATPALNSATTSANSISTASYQQIVSRQHPQTNQDAPSLSQSRSHPNTPNRISNRHQNESYASKMQTGAGANTASPRTGIGSQHSQYHQNQNAGTSSRARSGSANSYPVKKSPYASNFNSHSHSLNQHHNQQIPYRNNSTHLGGKSTVPGSPHIRHQHQHHNHQQHQHYPHQHHQNQHSHSHQHHSSSHSFQTNSGGGARSPPEVLKTLLRKKACLYEAGTSRSIALVTWLVGRRLALQDGYFSRQRLQAGVHAVVASKINSHMITRTKVNRCMQIILNSCFHYIIPKPDGTEENGETFCDVFRDSVENDSHLLKSLSSPWDDLDLSQADTIVNQKESEVPPSPKSTANVKHDGKAKNKGSETGGSASCPDDSQQKRVVLLCFNENVRSAGDVLRCHNDFIRDAAISSNLHLTSDEWRYFFSRKEDDCSLTSCTIESVTSAPMIQSSPIIKGAEGSDIPYLSFDIPPEISDCINFQDCAMADSKAKNTDLYGHMINIELSKFRTSWCCKRYEHDHRLCKFAHVDENKGWLRRDPTNFSYSDKLCPFITVMKSDNPSLNGCHVNACKEGLFCTFAHSQEEVDYHPKRYKSKVCDCAKGSGNGMRFCNLLDICPHSHPNNSSHHHRAGRRRNDSFSRKGGPKYNSADSSDKYQVPAGSPVLYLSPAPSSEFEKSLQFPGLRGLFRRNCTAHYANDLGIKGGKFSLFGDDCGLNSPLFQSGDGITTKFSLYSE